MRQALRFILALVAGLALLTWGASVVVSRTTRAWFERDMLLRAQLAVSGARETLVSHWAAGQRGGAAQGPHRADPRRACPGRGGLRRGPRAARPDRRLPRPALVRAPGSRRPDGSGLPCCRVDDLGIGVLGARGTGPRHRDPDRGGRPAAGLRRPRPRPELRRAARGDDATVPRAGLRLPGGRGLDRHADRGPLVLAGLEQRAAQADPGRAAAARVPTLPPRRPRPRRSPRLGPGGRRPGRPVDASAAQEHAEPTPPRRAGGDRGEPRALHPRAHRQTVR